MLKIEQPTLTLDSAAVAHIGSIFPYHPATRNKNGYWILLSRIFDQNRYLIVLHFYFRDMTNHTMALESTHSENVNIGTHKKIRKNKEEEDKCYIS